MFIPSAANMLPYRSGFHGRYRFIRKSDNGGTLFDDVVLNVYGEALVDYEIVYVFELREGIRSVLVDFGAVEKHYYLRRAFYNRALYLHFVLASAGETALFGSEARRGHYGDFDIDVF